MDAGIADVVKVNVNAPPVVVVVVWVMPSMVAFTVSPFGGYSEPALMIPFKVIGPAP